MDDRGAFRTLGLVAAAALATVAAVSWRAAEEHRGLDLADLRSVVIVAVAVLLVGLRMDRSRGR